MANALDRDVPAARNLNLVRESGGRLVTFPVAGGATFTITSRGTNFYFVTLTASANARARGKSAGAGDFSTYSQGTGDRSLQPFDFVDVQNPNSYAIVCQVWVGFDDFIDNRLILANGTNPQIAYPTYPVANAASIVQIRDLTGQAFSDVNGNKWLALFRVCILCFNLDTGTTALLYEVGGSGASPAVGVIYPAPLPIRFDFGGNFDINLGGASINMIVSEIYSAIPAS